MDLRAVLSTHHNNLILQFSLSYFRLSLEYYILYLVEIFFYFYISQVKFQLFNYKLCPQVSIGWFPSYTARHINKVFYFILSILFYSILQFFLSVFLLVTVCWPRPIFPYVVHAHSSQIKFAFSLKIHGVIHPSDGVWKILPNSYNPFLYFHFLDHYVTLSFLSTNSLI